MNLFETCSSCGSSLPDGVNHKQCPACLLKAGMEAETMPSGWEEYPESMAESPTMPTPRVALGTLIGRYKLLQEIGEGGFGIVYMAEQTEPVKRKVALKILKPGMDTREVVARFEAERQALALMDHPNIAQVFDGGSTEQGRPYFVMELVKGAPLTKYCDDHQFTTRQRLELFLDVIAAVQHAHQKGIIHRDLKPSNILVSPHDGKPVVKVIDFGIAKALSMELTSRTMFTGFGQMIGTPQYMSPEQAETNALDVDTRSDVYSLGVVLYELLTGRTPLDGNELRSAGFAEMQRLIREELPPKPSTCLSQTKAASPTIHNITPNALRGDLDWIVMKAIEKERTRRYETANAFALDIGRHLRNEPVLAGPPSAVYRLEKFVRRNRRALLSGAVAAVALLAGLAVAGGVWFKGHERMVRIEENAGNLIVEAERLMEQNAAAKFDDDASFRRASELARRAEELLKGTGGNISEVEKRSKHLMNTVHHEERARTLITGIEETLMKEMSTFSQGKSDKSSKAAGLAKAFNDFGVDPLHGRVEDTAERITAESAPLRDRIIVGLVGWQESLAKHAPEQAERLAEIIDRADSDPWRRKLRQAIKEEDSAALEALADSPEMKSQPTMTVLQLSSALEKKQIAGATVRLLRLAQQEAPESFWTNFTLGLTLAGAIDRDKDQDVSEKMFTISDVHFYSGPVGMIPEVNPIRPAFDEAIGFLRAAVAARPDAVMARVLLGTTLAAGGHLDEAIATHRTTASRNPEAAMLDLLIGSALFSQKRLEEAIPYLRNAVERDAASFIELYELGYSLAQLGRYDEARTQLLKAGDLEKRKPAVDSEGKPSEEGSLRIMGVKSELDELGVEVFIAMMRVLRGEGRTEILAACQHVLEVNPEDARAYAIRGYILWREGEFEAAKAALENAIHLGAESADLLNSYGATLLQLGDPAKALIQIEKALALKPDDAVSQTNFGVCLMELKRMDEAEAPLKKAVELNSGNPLALSNLGTWHDRQGDKEQAMAYYRKANAIDPNDRLSTKNIAVALMNAGEYKEAIPYYRRQNDPEEYAKLGAALAGKEMKAEAIDAFELALALKPEMAEVQLKLAGLYTLDHRYEDAITNLQGAVKSAPLLAQAHGMLGVVLSRQGRYDESMVSLLKAHDLEPDLPMIETGLISVLLSTGRIEAAQMMHGDCREAHCVITSMGKKHLQLKELLAKEGPGAAGIKPLLESVFFDLSHSNFFEGKGVAVDPEALRAVWDQRREDVTKFIASSTVRLIQINKEDDKRPGASAEEVKALAEGIVQKLAGGGSFAELAESYSEGWAGGKPQTVSVGDFPAELSAAAFTLEEGRFTPKLIEVEHAYCLLKVESRQAGKAEDFEDPNVQKAIRSVIILQGRRDWEQRYLARLRDPGPDLVLGKIQHLAGARLLTAGDRAKAKELFEQAIATFKPLLDAEDPLIRKAKKNLDLSIARLAEAAEGPPKAEEDTKEADLAGLKPEAAQSVEVARAAVDELKKRGTKIDDALVVALVELGFAYQKAIRFEDAAASMVEAEQVARRVHSGGHATVASCLYYLGIVCLSQGEYKQAAEAFKASLEMRKQLKVSDSKVADSLNSLGLAYKETGELDKAQAALEQALKIRQEVWGSRDRRVAETLNNLGNNFQQQAEFEEAEKNLRGAIEIYKGLGAEARFDLATTFSNLGTLLQSTGKAAEAAEALNEAIEMLEACKSKVGSPDLLAKANSNLGLVLIDQGKQAEARILFEKAIKIQDEALGSEHVNRLVLLNNLAMVLPSVEAEKVRRETLALATKRLGPDHLTIATCLINLAQSLSSNDKHEEAESIARQGLEMARRLFPNVSHPTVGVALITLADIEAELGKFPAAEHNAREAEKMAREIHGNMNLNTAECLSAHAKLLARGGQNQEAEVLLREVLEIKQKLLGDTDPRVVSALADLGTLVLQRDDAVAEKLLREALVRQSKPPGAEPRKVGETLACLAAALRNQGQLPEARKLYLEALAILKQEPESELQEANTLVGLGMLAIGEGNPADAEATLRQALAVLETIPPRGPSRTLRAQACFGLAKALRKQKKYPGAEAALQMALTAQTQAGGEVSPLAAQITGLRADLLAEQGRFPEAEQACRAVLQLRKKLHGEEHLEVASALVELAMVLKTEGKISDAENTHREALAIRRKLLGPKHSAVAESLSQLADVLIQVDELSEAEEVAREALAILRSGSATEQGDIGSGLVRLGSILEAQEKHPAAEESLLEALALLKKSYGDSHQQVAAALTNLGQVLSSQGKYAAAEARCQEAFDMMIKLKGKDDYVSLACLRNLAATFEAQTKHQAAEAAYRKVLEGVEKLRGPNHPDVSMILSNLGNSLSDQDKFAEAEQVLRRALTIQKASMGSAHPATQHALAKALRDQGKFAEADPLFESVLASCEKMFGSGHPNTAKVIIAHASSLAKQQKFEDAKPLAERALGIQEKALPLGDPDLEDTYEVLDKISAGLGNKEDAARYKKLAEGIREKAGTEKHRLDAEPGSQQTNQ